MRVMSSLTVCAALCAVAATANAESPNYIELGYGFVQIHDSGFSATPGVAILRYGYQITPNVAIEADGLATAQHATVYVPSVLGAVPFNIRVSGGGLFVKGSINPMPNLEFFAKVGAIDASVNAAEYGGSVTATGTSAAYGAGAHVGIGTSAYVQIEYMSYYDKNGAQAHGPALSIGWTF